MPRSRTRADSPRPWWWSGMGCADHRLAHRVAHLGRVARFGPARAPPDPHGPGTAAAPAADGFDPPAAAESPDGPHLGQALSRARPLRRRAARMARPARVDMR